MANILLVDDSPIMLEMYGRYLRNAGHEVTTAKSGQLALDEIAASTPELVVLDYMMPGMRGDQLLEMLRARRETKRVPILILTADDEPAKLARAIELGATAFMTKPIERSVFVSRVSALLNARGNEERRKTF